ncbi:conserved protein, unknown function [Plasmodium berghei]|uniref:ER membrane protein complex subunit 8, putative n=2 Tax=Plasmodium berghei TaxID=5821 RepID=A0A509AJG7_PLABA|nr:ER membrane protein complex subunit 8, putative [Plasmodium berghei ANKA]CXI40858.1 conserved protein, unknown function [Plasmodium berghei]SCM21851.1 conserved protein, unknown function [Plasmodium berghei]SCN25094.1 conserved protein, unknown function [Plasmodium berghei]SCO60114.1 conserved protein, unknown function [Plasmodium berghei]SCO61662.1 conserved protein, unknown function [Plasmodium berghei]|eukprot:XP_034421442.1 ER membrane protein complex subunit 8, putative [Plasmodium berghei ANKA]
MTGTEITIDHIAYAKIFMHALKNSYNDVCGILIGKYYNSENETKKCIISNTVPLFHTHILFAFLSLAFTMIEKNCKETGERIIGYYHISADDSKNDNISNIKICDIISDTLIKNYNDALICLVNISKLKDDEDNCIKTFIQDGNGKLKNAKIKISSKNKEFLRKSISNHEYLNIHDFDDHLNCINCDFMNPNLFKDSS